MVTEQFDAAGLKCAFHKWPGHCVIHTVLSREWTFSSRKSNLLDKCTAFRYVLRMQTLSVNEFRAHLKKVADLAISEHEPVRVTRRNNGNFILISEEDWNSEQETLYVLQNQSLMKQIWESSKMELPSKTLTQDQVHAEFDV